MGASDKVSTVAYKYPTYRDDVIRGCSTWLEGKRLDDNAEKLWRVHDKIYDLTEFIDRHPGGSNWIQLTKGTDITDQFETFHLTTKANSILPKYYVHDATKPRNYKLTYDENGFFKTLKRRVVEKLKDVDMAPLKWSKFYFNIVLIAVIVLAILSARSVNWYVAFGLATLNGIFINWLTIITHNFIHQKNNWRMYMMNITLMNWRDWRVFHAMSHHMYPNSYHDLEVSLFEPLIKWLPNKKSNKFVYFSWIFGTPIMYIVIFYGAFWLKTLSVFKNYQKTFFWDDLLYFFIPTIMAACSFDILLKEPLWIAILKVPVLSYFMVGAAGFFFGIVALNAGHHHPEITHEGDQLQSLDFGYYQMGATIERIEVSKYQFMILSHFGQHTLHHMFPTLDHGILAQLQSTFIETCKEFEVEMRIYPWHELLIGQFKQLARTEKINLC